MISVFQIGARRGYATAEIFQRNGILDKLWTDIFISPQVSSLVRSLGSALALDVAKGLSGRSNQFIPMGMVNQAPILAISSSLQRRAFKSFSDELLGRVRYSSRLEDILMSRSELPQIIYSVNREAPHLGAEVVRNGGKFIVEQTIPPLYDEIDQLLSSATRCRERGLNYPSTEFDGVNLGWFFERENSELGGATRIVCVSQFVRERLIFSGFDERKLSVVASGLRLPTIEMTPRRRGALRVLFVGQFGLRKGAPIFLELANRLGKLAEFRVIGDVTMPNLELQDFPNIRFLGRLPRASLGVHWEWADLLLFPSLNEGAAMVTFEALAYGVPVLCSYQSGSLVEVGVDGYIYNPWEIDEMEDRIRTLVHSRDLLDSLRQGCFENRRKVSIEAYSERLIAAVSDML